MRIEIDNKVISKWKPVIENYFKYKNDYIKNLICLYCQWHSSNDINLDLTEKLNDIFNKINLLSKREKIISQYFNLIKGIIEFELESGKIIESDSTDFELSTDELIEIFGIDFLRFIDKQELRDNQINKLWQS